METKTATKKKTKKEIEAAHPIVKPEDCPGELMKWIQKRDEDNFEKWLEMLRKELKPVARFMRMASQNRLWLIGLTTVVALVIVVVWIHIKMVVL